MTKEPEDITPEGSLCPVLLDSAPQEPIPQEGQGLNPEPTPQELELAELRHAAKTKIAAAAELTPAEAEAVLGPNGDPVPGA